MKKLLFLAALLLGFVACSNNDGAENQIGNSDSNQQENTTENPMDTGEVGISQTANRIEEILEEHGGYEPDQVARLLTGKNFHQWCYLEYNSSWAEIIFSYYSFGNLNDVGGFAADSYTFSADGTVSRRYVVTAIAPPNNEFVAEGKWEFDPVSRKLITRFIYDEEETIREFTLRALGEEIFVWDEVESEPLKEEFRYFRSVYIVQ